MVESFSILLTMWLAKWGVTVIIYYYTSDPWHMKQYEKAFLEKYGAKTTEIVKLTLDDSDIELLSQVCSHRVKKKQLVAKPPVKEVHYVGFKKEVHHGFRAEMIRCDEDLAMIGAFEPHCIFVLKKPKTFELVYHVWIVKAKQVQGLDAELFQFNEKFCYRNVERTPPARPVIDSRTERQGDDRPRGIRTDNVRVVDDQSQDGIEQLEGGGNGQQQPLAADAPKV